MNSRTKADAPLDFARRASKETKKLEQTLGPRGGMDEFRRLTAMYPHAPSRELAEFQVFAKAVAKYRKDGRGSEDRGGDNHKDCGDDQGRGRHSSRKDSSAGPRWDEKSDSSCYSSDFSHRKNRRRSHRHKSEKNRGCSSRLVEPLHVRGS